MSAQLCRALGARRGDSSASRVRRSRTVSAVAVATCAAVCTAAGSCLLPQGPAPRASSSQLLPLAFVAGGPPSVRPQPSYDGVTSQQCAGTFTVPCPTTTAAIPWFASASDFVQQGKFRGAARLVRTAGEKIAEVAPLGSVFSSCAKALRGAAAALLEERWVDAEGMIGVARDQFKASAGAPLDPRQALSALGADLEASAQELSEASADALEDAAAALRAAARMFVTSSESAARPRKKPARSSSSIYGNEGRRSRRRSQEALVKAFIQDPQLVSARVAAHLVAVAAHEDRKKMLRVLATRHHPDRNPGREKEVLPTFLLVQQLREEWRTSIY